MSLVSNSNQHSCRNTYRQNFSNTLYMKDFPITENQIKVLSDEKLSEVLDLVTKEYEERQANYRQKLFAMKEREFVRKKSKKIQIK